MLKSLLGVAVLVSGGEALAASTDFGIRTVSPSLAVSRDVPEASVAARPRVDLSGAISIGSRWGRVTSTVRSREHNRRVGGVRNSFHLSGRAIDIARRPGVRHADIAAAFRNAGYHLIESLDEGDHSHFAFGSGVRATATASAAAAAAAEATSWRMVYAPPSRGR